ncbi:hypothetical protein OF83DRAFT_1086528 [Amylostereum chailletii]|nr:hypothetical protein OF83DRAFT_1086528 [Amylostereum chailletii]
MHKILTTHELLDAIFTYLDRESNVVNAQVCSAWLEPALDRIWAEVDTPCQLFRLLAPLNVQVHLDGAHAHAFVRQPTREDWERFNTFARRVRRLRVYDHYNPDRRCLEPLGLLFFAVARTRPLSRILPNLTKLEWCSTDPNERFDNLFLHEDVKSLTIALHSDVENYPLKSRLRDIASIAPSLTEFALDNDAFGIIDVEHDLITLFDSLHSLAHISLPIYFLSSKLAERLSKSENIQRISFQSDPHHVHRGFYTDATPFIPHFQPGAFAALRYLALAATLHHVQNVVTDIHFPAGQLESLAVRVLGPEPEDAVHDFAWVVGERCKALTELKLALSVPPVVAESLAHLPAEEAYEAVTMDTLRGFTNNLHNLKTFEITHARPLELDDDNIAELATMLPNLQTLKLAHDPDDQVSSLLSFRALVALANHCPNLRTVGLYLDSSRDLHELPIYPPRLANLRCLHVGHSTLTEEDRSTVVLFLSRIVSTAARLKWGTDREWIDDVVVEPLERVPLGHQSRWKAVEDLLAMALLVRGEERMRPA